MADNLHDVVELLLARMKSHPEEFAAGSSRWGWMVEEVLQHCSNEERDAIKEGLRPIRLKEVHEHVMDELCNGEERRRKEREEDETRMRQYQMQQQYAAAQNMQPGQYMAVSSPSTLGIGAATPSQGLYVTSGNLQLGNETLDEGILKKIKGALGI
jgi:hypothetical protein